MRLKKMHLESVSGDVSHFRFEDQDSYDLRFSRTNFDRCEWRNLRIKSARFKELALTRSTFFACYMPKSEFDRVDLTGTHFIGCNLKSSKFPGSKLWYVEFSDCEIDYDAILENLPPEVNIKRRLLHSLRLNSLGRREKRIASRLLILEMAAARDEDRNIFLSASEYFRDNYSTRDRVVAFGRWITSHLENMVWGYGVRLRALFRSAVLAIVLAAAIVWVAGVQFLNPLGSPVEPFSFWEALFMAAVTFTNYGGYFPVNFFGRAVIAGLSASGALFLGLLAAAAFKRIER